MDANESILYKNERCGKRLGVTIGDGGRTYGNRLLPLFFIAWRFERAGSGNFELHRSYGCLRYVGIRNGRGHGTDAGGGRCDDTRIYIV